MQTLTIEYEGEQIELPMPEGKKRFEVLRDCWTFDGWHIRSLLARIPAKDLWSVDTLYRNKAVDMLAHGELHFRDLADRCLIDDKPRSYRNNLKKASVWRSLRKKIETLSEPDKK